MALGLGECRAVAIDVSEGGVVLLLLLLMVMPMAVDDAALQVRLSMVVVRLSMVVKELIIGESQT